MKKETKSIFIIVGVVLILAYSGIMNNMFFGAIEDAPSCEKYITVNGDRVCQTYATCTTDVDCEFCIGDIFVNQSHELKDGTCVAGQCYVSEYCLNSNILKQWIKDHPWAWAKQNQLLFYGIVAFTLFGIYAFLPRRRGKIFGK